MFKKVWINFNKWICLSLAIFVAAIAIAFSTPSATSQTPPPTSTEVRGVWLTNVSSGVLFAPWGINRAIRQLSRLNFNTVYPVVWNRGHTFYPSTVAKTVTGKSQDSLLKFTHFGQDTLADIINQGHRQNLSVIAWFEYGFMAPVHSELTERHPQWVAKRRDLTENVAEEPNLQIASPAKKSSFKQKLRQQFTRQNVWLNPLHPEVQDFILDLIIEVVSQYDVDGIQLDDHFGMPVELGYDTYTIWLYRQEHQGKMPPSDYLDAEWMRWRANKISQFMQRIYQTVKEVKPNCIVSLSPNYQTFAYKHYLQDWQTWVKQGWIEDLVLQVYRESLNSFLIELTQPALQEIRDRIPISIGISTGTWQRPVSIQQIEQQIQAVRDRTFDGVSFFYWESLWGYLAPESPQQRREGFQSYFSKPAIRPQLQS